MLPFGTFYEILTLVDLYINSVLFKLLYLPQGLRHQHPIFYHTILCINKCLWQTWCQRYEVLYLMWFKTATSSGRSIRSVRRGVLSLLICPVYPIHYGDTALQINACCFVPIISANRVQFNVWGNYWHESSGKMYINFTQRYFRNG